MRTPVIAGNWKMHLDRSAALGLVDAIASAAGAPGRRAVELGVAPPFPYLDAVVGRLRGTGVFVAGQNLHDQPHGAFTGEVSGSMLADVGCTHVLVGHSERRRGMGETPELAGRKLRGALRSGLVPILCVGESLAEREAGRTEAVVITQLEEGLRGVSAADAARLLVAYEPVWAIGTGVNATPKQAGAAHLSIRNWLASRFSSRIADDVRILYGGSVKPENARELLSVEDVDGALVGGASLNAPSFLGIVSACPGGALEAAR